ncbi:MAG: hypothetical protein M1827_004756 [Pycnora praestabilis]|nr:MAG: hypothetical protein M1827_004756 [Pycnora praestabilis]
MASLITLLVSRADNNSNDNSKDLCTLETCPIQDSYFNYLPSLAANSVFLALFSLSLICFLFQGFLSKRFVGFTIAVCCGCALEVLGYVGRLMSHHDPFNQNGFLMQIICLTIAPAFMAAGLYLCLSRIVLTFGPANSRIAPLSYPRIFIPCDFFSLVLQALGGGMASVATHQNKSPNTGDHIMVAGLAFQVATLALFILLCADFAFRTITRMRSLGASEALDPTHAKLRASWSFRGFIVCLAIATICIFIRSIYRVIELSEGWEGALIKNQGLFIGLEGVMVIIAMVVLNAFHPGLCFREGYVKENTEVLRQETGAPRQRWLASRRPQEGRIVSEKAGSGNASDNENGLATA